MADKRGVLTMTGDVTGAQAMVYRKGMGARSGAARKRSRRKVAKSARRKVRKTARKTTRKGKRPARLVKGSAAAKRYMAKIRKLRKR